MDIYYNIKVKGDVNMEIKFVTTSKDFEPEAVFMFNYFGELVLEKEQLQPKPVWADMDDWYVQRTDFHWVWKIKQGFEEPATNYYKIISNADLLN